MICNLSGKENMILILKIVKSRLCSLLVCKPQREIMKESAFICSTIFQNQYMVRWRFIPTEARAKNVKPWIGKMIFECFFNIMETVQIYVDKLFDINTHVQRHFHSFISETPCLTSIHCIFRTVLVINYDTARILWSCSRLLVRWL